MYAGIVDCRQPTPMPPKTLETAQTPHVLATHSMATLMASRSQYQYMDIFLPNLSVMKGKVTIPMIWPTDPREFQTLSTEDARTTLPSSVC